MIISAGSHREERNAIEVPLQRQATNSKRALAAEIAFTSCRDLGIQGLLNRLNNLFDPDHVLHMATRRSRRCYKYALIAPSILGLACSMLAPRWHMSASDAQQDITLCGSADRRLRKEALVG